MPINYLKKIQSGEFDGNGYRLGPSMDIASIIEGFYIFSRDPTCSTDLIFNDGFPVLVFLQNREDRVVVTGKSGSFEIQGAWASAGSIKNVYVEHHNTGGQIFIVRFHPATFYQLFGLDARYFRGNHLCRFQDIAETNNFSIRKFFECSSIAEKTTFVETYVRNAFPGADNHGILNQTLSYIHKIKGKGTVRNITADAGVNYKWLERSFMKNIGLLPKEYIQLQRFIHAYVELVRCKEIDLMGIAVSNGYYDSNHFLKDFKTYTGKTPLEYLRLQLHDDLRRVS